MPDSSEAVTQNTLDELCIQTIRFLSMDGVQAANSGHPGMPMGMASAAYTLWTQFLRYNPKNPQWHNRDRFVLSAGHGSMLLYSMLHLTGYDLPLEELKNFRQWGSKTPGHPEHGVTPGVEVTTGPLGQGLGNAVGMAIAQKHLAAIFNRPGFDLFDYNIYVFSGDGCLQEGVSSEACSLAGHLGLDNLILIYDDNHITIDGETDLSFSEDRAKRFEAYNWQVQVVPGDGNDRDMMARAVNKARKHKGQPSMIQLRTHIGFGSPHFQDTHTAHGAPLGVDEIKLIKKNFGWDPEKTFHVPDEVKQHMSQAVEKGRQAQDQWNQLRQEYQKKFPDLAGTLKLYEAGADGINIDEILPEFEPGQAMATRKASGMTLNSMMGALPFVLGGSADLTPSNNTQFKGADDFQKDCPTGRYIRYGVREHAMGAVMNGICASGLLRAYGGTFLVFSDYMRPPIRMAALSHHNPIYVFTHDSIGVGEDGPTHQPVEHVAALRLIPNVTVIRPADAHETAQAWKCALKNTDGPTALILTRQGLPVLDQTKYASAVQLEKGAYTLYKTGSGAPDALLLASGSEVSLALDAAELLLKENINVHVISMPCWELFEKQDQAYKDSVLLPEVSARVGVEAGMEQGWSKWLGDKGIFIGMSSFGASAPGKTCFQKFGITPEAVARTVKEILAS
ncbi:MAG: transketolase [Sedimentisphaerales bacterium]|nr:transketolase [Sedimentisphaerales bacterium]